ncbi:MAG TPA: HAMP domain-containing sensor histidine kinase [Nocardioides sp.]|nr:HAMP domain-containing sensor histidine kinase [Nocardioides sp.]
MSVHPCLQDTTARGPVSPEAAGLTATILGGGISLDDAIAQAAEHLLTDPRVEVVGTSLTSFDPEQTAAWARLGGRAWVREWSSPEAPISILPPPGAGAEAALTMPWLSRHARAGVAVLVDRDLLPPEGHRDREELARIDVKALIGTVFLSEGEMFGSLSVASRCSGPWSEVLVEDLRLLTSAIASRMTLGHSRRALAEAIEAGTEAQLAYQHFFAAVGHELRTPLTAMLGYTEVLVDDAAQTPEHPVSQGLLRDGPVILRAGEQLLAVVDSLLGAGRTMSADDQRQDVSISDALADVVHWHLTPARTAGVEIHVDVDPTVTAWAHPSGVRQVLTNLVGNAITHHRPSGGHVHLSTTRLLGESGQPMVRVIVRDDGPGLSAEQLRHVFEPFTRFADHTTLGSGLGLSISRTIAERDGGAVRAESTVGEGSSFWLELPASAPPRA